MMKSTDSPETYISEAQAAYKAEKYRRAAECFQQAADIYAQCSDFLAEAEQRNNCSVALLKADDAPGALEASLGTERVFEQAGDLRRQAIALGNQAAALETLGDLNLALSLYEQSAMLLKQTGDTEYRPYVLQRLSALQMRKGKQLEALASMHTALQNKKGLSLKEKLLSRLLKIPFRMVK